MRQAVWASGAGCRECTQSGMPSQWWTSPGLDAGRGWPPARRRSGAGALDRITLEAAVVAEATGYATTDERDALEAAPLAWVGTLRRLLLETDDALVSAGRLLGEERPQVLADLNGERRSLAAALQRLTGEAGPDDQADAPPAAEPVIEAPAPARL